MTPQDEGAKHSRIPEFASREEEAAFWDTHSISDFWDELRPVEVRFAEELSEGITVHFAPETLAALHAIAREQGEEPAALLRGWVLERLHEVEAGQRSPRAAGVGS